MRSRGISMMLIHGLFLCCLFTAANSRGVGSGYNANLRRKRVFTASTEDEGYSGPTPIQPGDELGDLWEQASAVATLEMHTNRILQEYPAVEMSLSMSVTFEPTRSALPMETMSPSLGPGLYPTVAPAQTSIPRPPSIPTQTPSDTRDPTMLSPTPPPTHGPTQQHLPPSPVAPFPIMPSTPPSESCLMGRSREDFFAERLAASTDEVLLLDTATPQGMAFSFLVHGDPFLANPCFLSTIEQRFALTTLFFATQGTTWTRSDSWLGESHECEWFGVACEKRGSLFATKLELAFNNLDGSLPEEVASLFMVQELDLFANSLTGTIPRGIANLTRVVTIDLQENLLTGAAFPSFMVGSAALQGYRVNGNSLGGSIPTQISALRNLKQLWMGDNDLTGTIPSELGALQDLNSLFLFENSFLGSLPSEIGLLPLEDIRVYGNFLQGSIPTQIFNVGSLRSFRLENNFFLGEIPSTIGQLTNLIDLRVNNNNLSGEIPNEVGLLTNLEYLLLNENFWRSTIPDVFQEYERLDFFDISNTMVFGAIPATLFSIPTLRIAYFSNCALTGTIPSSYSDPPLLRDLFLDGNRLTGEIPPVPTGKLEFLNEFLVHRTLLSGSMPQSVCDLRRANILDDLWADCGGEVPEIVCSFPLCCNRCFEGGATSRRLDWRPQL